MNNRRTKLQAPEGKPLKKEAVCKIPKVKKIISKTKTRRNRDRKSRAKFVPNPKAYKRRVIKLVEKIKFWKTQKYQKIVNKYWKGEKSEDSLYEEEDSVFSLETLDFQEKSSELSVLERVECKNSTFKPNLSTDTPRLYDSLTELIHRQNKSQKAYRYFNLKMRFSMERIRRKVANSLPSVPNEKNISKK